MRAAPKKVGRGGGKSVLRCRSVPPPTTPTFFESVKTSHPHHPYPGWDAAAPRSGFGMLTEGGGVAVLYAVFSVVHSVVL